ncbi:hypothetical protein N658DRAFT_519247 [Parathielavia hyrcaniae]|uniref:Chromo domain-containing protein n=1 Tax=Parathielavia hyrcaniae TaxID=113614 RepID=A0AAN6PR07_9PEZI|nr:hypothetical protein N658DRAFT_519247 [Parathielavia hyrcaniae]
MPARLRFWVTRYRIRAGVSGAHADGREKALQQNTRHHCFGEAGLGNPWRPRTIRPRSRVVIRGDTQLYRHNYEGPVNRSLEPRTTRRFTTEHVSCETVGMVERVQVADSEVEPAFLRTCKYISLVPRHISVCLDSQFFYDPPVAAGPEPASRGLRVQEGGPSKAIFGAPLHPPLPQDAHEPQGGGTGESRADAILIPSDDEFDLDGLSDTSFDSLGGLLSDARNKVDSGHTTGTAGKGIDAASDNSDAPEPSVAGMARLDNKSPAAAHALHAEQDGPIPASSVSRRPLMCAGWSCRQGDGRDRHPDLSAAYRRLRKAKSPTAKADNEGSERDELELADAGLPLQPPYSQDRINFRRDVGGQCNTDLEADYRPICSPVPDDRREQNGMCSAVPPQVNCSPIVGSDAKQGKNEDVVQPPPGKRRRVNTSTLTTRRTAPKRRTRPQPSPTQGPKRRQSQRSSSKPQPPQKPQSSGRSVLEEETRTEDTFASFEEWPLEAVVLKRALVNGTATFQVQFTWNPCTNHGRNDTARETNRHKPPAEKASPTGCALPLRAARTAKEVQDCDYFQVEAILDGRRRKGRKGRKGGWEYLVKWAGYGHEHNSWEPGAHFEQCPEILQQFRNG